jgi:hypothetical protein
MYPFALIRIHLLFGSLVLATQLAAACHPALGFGQETREFRGLDLCFHVDFNLAHTFNLLLMCLGMCVGKLPEKLRKFWIVTVTMVVNLLEKIINAVTIKTSAL